MQSRYRFTCAWLADGWHRNVVISVDPEGEIVDVSADDTVTTARMINGVAIPGMPNIHSHAFQRAMAGLVEQRSGNDDSFWTWRETMYEHASLMTPECLNAIAAQLYADMLKAGYTSVCEFHYLHGHGEHRSHEDRLAMCRALMDAATTSGIGMTLLPTLYQTSDFGGAPPTARQRQFTMETKHYLDLLDGLRDSERSAQFQIGIALHSLRAVPPESLRAVLDSRRDSDVVHIHIAEQEREVEACQQHFGRRPIQWLVENVSLDKRWCLVHATHATAEELQAVASTGAVIGLCPTTEANLGDGVFPMEALLAVGGAFAIGSDSHISLSPIEELRWLEYQARLSRRQRNVLNAGGASGGAMLWRKACEAGVPRNLGRLDVTTAVDTATSFVVETVRGWRWFSRWGMSRGEVDITQQELGADSGTLADISNGSDVIASADHQLGAPAIVADYVAAYDAGETQYVRMPNFRREHKWELTYRSDAADAISQPAQSDRFPGMNTTLDDSVVLGLRFEWEYGWTR